MKIKYSLNIKLYNFKYPFYRLYLFACVIYDFIEQRERQTAAASPELLITCFSSVIHIISPAITKDYACNFFPSSLLEYLKPRRITHSSYVDMQNINLTPLKTPNLSPYCTDRVLQALLYKVSLSHKTKWFRNVIR